MPRKAQDVTDAELAVLEVLWERKTTTVRAIAEEIYRDASASQHATVQKLLDRLRAKKCVSRNAETWPHLFSAAIEREDLIGRRLQSTADSLCGGSLQPLLTHLIKNTKLTAEQRRNLRQMVDDLDKGSSKRSRK